MVSVLGRLNKLSDKLSLQVTVKSQDKVLNKH